MKKLLLKSMLLLSALIVGSSSVWATDVTFTPNVEKTNQMTLTKDGISLALESSGGTFNRDDNYRVYSGKSLTVSSTVGNITSIVITCTANKGSDYGPDKLSTSTGTYTTTTGSKIGTWSGSATSLVFAASAQCRITSIVVSYTPSSSDLPSGASFANATPSLDLKTALTYCQEATTASGYSSEVGASVTYEITANTAGASIIASTGVVTPTHAGSVTVKATAAAIAGKYTSSSASYTLTVTDTRVWTVTCHIGNNTSNVNRTSGDALELDAPEDICGMSFVGWSSTDNAASPTWVANTTNVMADMDVYAIFQAVAGEYSYRLVEANQADWRGDYLIAYDDETFADGRKGGTDTGCIGKQYVSVNPSTNLSGKVVDVTWGDTYNVTIEAKDENKLSDGYLLKTKDGKYNYQTSNSNGLASTDNRSTAANYPLSITFNSSSDIDIAISAGAVFHYNEQGYFRFYKDGGQKNVYLYKRTEDVAPVYSLGTTVAVTPGYEKITYVTTQIVDFKNVSGLKAYVATDAAGSEVTMTRVEAPVPVGTPLLLIGTPGTTYNVPVVGSATAPATNYLVAGTGAENWATIGGYNYILYSDGLFYQVTSGPIATTKAYLHLTSDPTAGGARALDIVFDDETTGIKENNRETIANNQFFDLSGRKVAQPTKGLYIVNGKKVIIK